MSENHDTIFDPIVAVYRAAEAEVPSVREYNRKRRITQMYVDTLDPVRHAAAIEAAWARFVQDNPGGDDLTANRLTIRSIGRVLRNRHLIY